MYAEESTETPAPYEKGCSDWGDETVKLEDKKGDSMAIKDCKENNKAKRRRYETRLSKDDKGDSNPVIFYINFIDDNYLMVIYAMGVCCMWVICFCFMGTAKDLSKTIDDRKRNKNLKGENEELKLRVSELERQNQLAMANQRQNQGPVPSNQIQPTYQQNQV